MKTAFYLLLSIGWLGALDVCFFHVWRCRLFLRPESRFENATHAVRALLYALLVFATVYVDAGGVYAWLLVVLCATEICNTALDVWLEHRSRVGQGGLPPGEYSLHMALSLLTGAAIHALLIEAAVRVTRPDAFTLRTLDVPGLLLPGANMSIAIALGFFLFESFNVVRLSLLSRGASYDARVVSPSARPTHARSTSAMAAIPAREETR